MKVDWSLLGRYALLIALTALIPVPFLDTYIENRLRRRMVKQLGARHGLVLSEESQRVLGDAPSGGCLGMIKTVLLWPFRKVLKTLLMVFQVKGIADVSSEMMHRGLMIEEALSQGWLPEQAERVREAMDLALTHVDTRLLERQFLGRLRSPRHELNGLVWEATEAARAHALIAAAEGDTLGPKSHQMSEAMVATLQATGLVPEVLQWFRAEMAPGERREEA